MSNNFFNYSGGTWKFAFAVPSYFGLWEATFLLLLFSLSAMLMEEALNLFL